ncbi:MAG: putative toxin-antitoxin system toxin component, PIN family [Anaerolineae bacterium]|nr:putative toxin-antitoxin system toxin component, PIN family [Anaerolineae bacterium]
MLVSYTLTKGETLSRLIDYWERGSFIYLTSPPIIRELKEVLQRPRLRAKMVADPHSLIEVIEADTEQTPGQLILEQVCRDPKDAMFIACAVEGQADYIVSWDKDLLDLGEYQGIKIVRAEAFIAVLDTLAEGDLEE